MGEVPGGQRQRAVPEDVPESTSAGEHRWMPNPTLVYRHTFTRFSRFCLSVGLTPATLPDLTPTFGLAVVVVADSGWLFVAT